MKEVEEKKHSNGQASRDHGLEDPLLLISPNNLNQPTGLMHS
jgi:hypothetical protein